MIRVEPLTVEHLEDLAPQPEQKHLLPKFVELFKTGALHDCYAIVGDEVLACFAFIDMADSCHIMAILCQNPPMVRLHRVSLEFLDGLDIDATATVETGFENGVRWLEMLGFNREKTIPKAGADGSDHYFYRHEVPRETSLIEAIH